MRLVVGIDEAGYGPNLGPLVIAASIWSIKPDHSIDDSLRDLAPVFRPEPWQPDASFLPLGDSKAIYRSGLSLDGLRAGVHFLLNQSGCKTTGLSDLLHTIACTDSQRVENLPWYSPQLDRLPETSHAIDRAPPTLRPGLRKLGADALQKAGIRFLGYQARVIDEHLFNQTVAKLENKSNALSEWSIGLLRDVIARYRRTDSKKDGPWRIEGYCDRHGGRKRYAPVLTAVFGEQASWFEILDETPQCSRYRTQLGTDEFSVQFLVRGDSLLPSAASSMLAKLLREELMQRLNRYWAMQCNRPLRPTAGYAVDAARFHREIAVDAQRIGRPLDAWWRSR